MYKCDQILWKQSPNRTLAKIKLTLPVDSYTTILLVSITLLKAGFNGHLFWEVWKACWVVLGFLKGLASREPVVNWYIHGLYNYIVKAFCVVCFVCQPTKEPAQPYNLIPSHGLHLPFWSVTPLPPSTPCLYPLVSTHDTSFNATGQISILFGGKL